MSVNTHRLIQAVVDDVWDHFDIDDEPAVDWFVENVERPVRQLICEYEGHDVIDDQCMMPAHRYCVVCGVVKPNMPVGRCGMGASSRRRPDRREAQP